MICKITECKCLKAGTNLDELTIEGMLKLDAKEVMLKDLKSIIAVVNTVDIEEVMKKKLEVEKKMQDIIKEECLGVFIFVITDILNCNSQVIVLGERCDIVEKAYSVKLVDNTAFLEGVVSRKKQIIPVIAQKV